MEEVKLQFVDILEKRFSAPDPLIQVVLGPRQVGKTTGVQQFLRAYDGESHFSSADDILSPGREWLLLQWQEAKRKKRLLVIDEIQKIENWSETVKNLWDNQKMSREPRIPLLLLGSSSFSIQRGLTESLAGRYEVIKVFHWNYVESNMLYPMTIDQYLRYGGYPGSYQFIEDPERWRRYMIDSIIDPVINKDIFGIASIKKPALFRQSFEILASYPAQEISYRKLLGQLQDRGNTDQIKYYIELFTGVFLFTALAKFSSQSFKIKSSSPKVLPMCPAIYELQGVDAAHEKYPQVFEASVGAALARLPGNLFYWRDGNFEVDFIYQYDRETYAVEVKSGRTRAVGGLAEFCKRFNKARPLIVNKDNYQEFVSNPHSFL